MSRRAESRSARVSDEGSKLESVEISESGRGERESVTRGEDSRDGTGFGGDGTCVGVVVFLFLGTGLGLLEVLVFDLN